MAKKAESFYWMFLVVLQYMCISCLCLLQTKTNSFYIAHSLDGLFRLYLFSINYIIDNGCASRTGKQNLDMSRELSWNYGTSRLVSHSLYFDLEKLHIVYWFKTFADRVLSGKSLETSIGNLLKRKYKNEIQKWNPSNQSRTGHQQLFWTLPHDMIPAILWHNI